MSAGKTGTKKRSERSDPEAVISGLAEKKRKYKKGGARGKKPFWKGTEASIL